MVNLPPELGSPDVWAGGGIGLINCATVILWVITGLPFFMTETVTVLERSASVPM